MFPIFTLNIYKRGGLLPQHPQHVVKKSEYFELKIPSHKDISA